MSRSLLRIGVLDLRRRPGTQREVHVEVALPGLAITTAEVPEGADVTVDGTLEAIEGAVTFSGTVTAPWTAECRRCLEPVSGQVEAVVSEVFEPHPTDGETYPLEGDEIDLEPVVRDSVLLGLPLAPLCRPDCAGPAPDTFPTLVGGRHPAGGEDADDEAEAGAEEPPVDERWAALQQLKLE